MKWVQLLVCVMALGCGDAAAGLQFENPEMRTRAEVEAEGSCACPAGHRLSCVNAGGAVVPVDHACFVVPLSGEDDDVLEGFSLLYAGRELSTGPCAYEPTTDPDEQTERIIDTLFCNPL